MTTMVGQEDKLVQLDTEFFDQNKDHEQEEKQTEMSYSERNTDYPSPFLVKKKIEMESDDNIYKTLARKGANFNERRITYWDLGREYPRTDYPIYFKSGMIEGKKIREANILIPYGDPSTFEKQVKYQATFGTDELPKKIRRAIVAYSHLKIPDRQLTIVNTEIMKNIDFLDKLFGLLWYAAGPEPKIKEKLWDKVLPFPKRELQPKPQDKQQANNATILTPELQEKRNEIYHEWLKHHSHASKADKTRYRMELLKEMLRQQEARPVQNAEDNDNTLKLRYIYKYFRPTPQQVALLASYTRDLKERLIALQNARKQALEFVFNPDAFISGVCMTLELLGQPVADGPDKHIQALENINSHLDAIIEETGDDTLLLLRQYDGPALLGRLHHPNVSTKKDDGLINTPAKLAEVNARIDKKRESRKRKAARWAHDPKNRKFRPYKPLEEQRQMSDNEKKEEAVGNATHARNGNIDPPRAPVFLDRSFPRVIPLDHAVRSGPFMFITALVQEFTPVINRDGTQTRIEQWIPCEIMFIKLEENQHRNFIHHESRFSDIIATRRALIGGQNIPEQPTTHYTSDDDDTVDATPQTPNQIDAEQRQNYIGNAAHKGHGNTMANNYEVKYVGDSGDTKITHRTLRGKHTGKAINEMYHDYIETIKSSPEFFSRHPELSTMPVDMYYQMLTCARDINLDLRKSFSQLEAEDIEGYLFFGTDVSGPQFLVSAKEATSLYETNNVVVQRCSPQAPELDIPLGQTSGPYIKGTADYSLLEQDLGLAEVLRYYIAKVSYLVNPQFMIYDKDQGWQGKLIYTPNKLGTVDPKHHRINAYFNTPLIKSIITYEFYKEEMKKQFFTTHSWVEEAMELGQRFIKFKGTPYGQLRRFQGCLEISKSVQPPENYDKPLVFWEPEMVALTLEPELVRMMSISGQFAMPTGSTIGILGESAHRGLSTQALELFYYEQFTNDLLKWDPSEPLDKYPYLKAGLIAEGKPKIELYELENTLQKSRTIFSLNSYTQIPLQLLLYGYRTKFGWKKGQIYNPGDINVLYAVDSRAWLKDFCDNYLKGAYDKTEPIWWVYSDNIYGYENGYFISFDGTKMESSCGKPEYLTELLKYLIGAAASHRSTQIKLVGYKDYKKIFDDVIQPIKQTVDANREAYEEGRVGPLALMLMKDKATVPDFTFIKDRSYDYTNIAKLPKLLNGCFVYEMNINEDTEVLYINQAFAPPPWFDKYIEFMAKQISSAIMVNGKFSIGMNFMPSGNTFTTVLNTTVSYITVKRLIERGFTPLKLADKIGDTKYNAHYSVLTFESKFDMRNLRLNDLEEGFYKCDFLGYDLFFKPKVGWSVMLRKNSILAGTLYFTKDVAYLATKPGHPSVMEVSMATSMSYLVNGGLMMTDLALANINNIAKYPFVNQAILRALNDEQSMVTEPDNPFAMKIDVAKTATSEWWRVFIREQADNNVVRKLEMYDYYVDMMCETAGHILRSVIPASPEQASQIPVWLKQYHKYFSQKASDYQKGMEVVVDSFVEKANNEIGTIDDNKLQDIDVKGKITKFRDMMAAIVTTLASFEAFQMTQEVIAKLVSTNLIGLTQVNLLFEAGRRQIGASPWTI